MLPTHERLDGGDRPRLEVDDRLVVKLQLVVENAAPEFRNRGETIRAGGVELVVVEGPAEGLCLCPVHRDVSTPQQRRRVRAVRWRQDNSHAGRQRHVELRQGKRDGDLRHNAFSERPRCFVR